MLLNVRLQTCRNPAIINRRENYLFPRPSGLYQLLCLFSRVCPRRLAVGSPCRTVQFRAGVLTRPRPPPLICALHARVTCPGSHTPPAASPPPSPFDVQVTGRKDVRALTVEALWQRDQTQTDSSAHAHVRPRSRPVDSIPLLGCFLFFFFFFFPNRAKEKTV